MAVIEIAVDAQTLKAVIGLTNSINSLNATIQSGRAADTRSGDNWFSAPHFCEKYDISRATLTRRVANGKVEKREFDDGIIRYRMNA